MWWTDPRHPELGRFWVAERLAVDPAWRPLQLHEIPDADELRQDIADAFGVPLHILDSSGDLPVLIDQAVTAAAGAGELVLSAEDLADLISRGAVNTDALRGGQIRTTGTYRTDPHEWHAVGATEEGHAFAWTEEPTGETDMDDRNAWGKTASQTELERRLAESRCYWCGLKLDTDDPYEMFCSEQHSREWRISTQVRADDYATVTNSTDYCGEDGLQPDPGEQPPSWLGSNRDPVWRPAFPVTPHPAENHLAALRRRTLDRLRATRPELPMAPAQPPPSPGFYMEAGAFPVIVHNPPPLDRSWDWKIFQNGDRGIPRVYAPEPSTLEPEGILIPPGSGTRATEGRFAVGLPWLPGPALRQLDRGPFADRTGWPLEQLRIMLADGWLPLFAPSLDTDQLAVHFAEHPAREVFPRRRCPHCAEVNYAVLHTAEFGYPERQTGLTWTGDEGPPQTASVWSSQALLHRCTHLVCGGCMLPYPGPTAVPLARRRNYHWELAVVTPLRIGTGGVAREGSFLDLPPGIREAHLEELWGDVYWHALEAGGHPCWVPACAQYARTWYSLAAPMVWQGRELRPEDQEPILLGLCPEHGYHLTRDAYTSADLYTRVNSMRIVGDGSVDSGLVVT